MDECEAQRLSTAEKKKFRNLAFRRTYQRLLEKNAVSGRNAWVWLV